MSKVSQELQSFLDWAEESNILDSADFLDKKDPANKIQEWWGIPDNPKYFSDVRKLNLSFMFRGYFIPDGFFRWLRKLKELDLSSVMLFNFPKPPEVYSLDTHPLEKLSIGNYDDFVTLPDEFMNLTNLKTLEVSGRGIRVSKKLHDWLIERNLVDEATGVQLKAEKEPITINETEYVIGESIITVIAQSVDIISEEVFEPEMKLSEELSPDSEIVLEVKGELESGSFNVYDKDENSERLVSRNIEVLLRPFSKYNKYVDLERTEGRIGSYFDETSATIYVSGEVIQKIREEYERGNTRMAISILCQTYAPQYQYDTLARTMYDRDILLVNSHPAVLARYVMRRELEQPVIEQEREVGSADANIEATSDNIEVQLDKINEQIHSIIDSQKRASSRLGIVMWIFLGWSIFIILGMFTK